MSSYVVTGAARGIGYEFVRQLSVDPKNTIFALVRNKSTATKLSELKAANVHLLEADITNIKALKAAAAAAAKVTGGSLDYLINNAALVEETRRQFTLDGYPEGQDELLEKDLEESFHINVVGVVHTINAFLPLLRKGTAKKVITLSSGLGDPEMTLVSRIPNAAPYSISKAAVNMVVAKYAAQYQDEGFVFLSISPGLVDTSTQAPTPEQIEEYTAMVATFRKVYPHFERALTPEESVKAQFKVIYGATTKDSGAFVSHHGNKEWL